MLVLFYGTHRNAARDRATDFFIEQKAEPGGIRQVSGSEYTAGRVSEMVGAQSLFGGVEYFLLDTPSSDRDFDDEVANSLKDLASSTNVFVILEGSLLAADKKKYEKHAKVVVEFSADKPERFNTFALADALAKKDKKNLWVLLQQANIAGLRTEEITGMLWWQLKALRLAKQTNNAEEADMKEYPYKKAKGSLRNFKEGEVEQLSQSLLELYHNGHKGISDMELQLERWVLTM
jgi:DNA polymerase III delta subunit